jgi:hypothetical protein
VPVQLCQLLARASRGVPRAHVAPRQREQRGAAGVPALAGVVEGRSAAVIGLAPPAGSAKGRTDRASLPRCIRPALFMLFGSQIRPYSRAPRARADQCF